MSRILALPILFVVGVAFTIKQEGQKEKQTFSGQQQSSGFYGDTVPQKTPDVIVEEIYKKVGSGVIIDTKNKIYLEADEIVYKNAPNSNSPKVTTALLIVKGKKVNNDLLKEKTIISKKVTAYDQNDKDAIALYGSEAAQGTMVFEGALIIDKKDSKIYNELQKDTIPQKRQDENQVFTKMDVEPKFAANWSTFLQKNLDPTVPVHNGAPAGKYEVQIRFIVDKEGNLSQFEALTKHGFGMEEEVMNLLKKSPNWEPGIQNGRKVNAYKIQKVTFVISEEEEQILAATDKLYIAIDNPIKLDIDNVKREDLSVSISQGSIHWAGSYYIARVNTVKPATITVSLKDGDNTRELASRTFAADVLESNKEVFEELRKKIKSFTN